MKSLRFFGASDDLFECESNFGYEEEIGCYGSHGVYRVTAGAEGLYVVAYYGATGSAWTVGVAPLREGASMPNWPMRFATDTSSPEPYSPVLVIDVPDDVQVEAIDSE